MADFSMEKLNELIEKRNIDELKEYMKKHNLTVKDGKIVPKNVNDYKNIEEFWNQRQNLRKILLNSLYGAILNEYCRFYDQRIGQSVTLTGRSITKHMIAKTNEIITGEYNYQGESAIYGDSVTGDSLIRLENGNEIKISELYDKISYKTTSMDGKHYAIPSSNEDDYKVLSFNKQKNSSEYSNISYVMKHKTSKKKWTIVTDSGKRVTTTEDHGIMVSREGFVIAVKPEEIRSFDFLINEDCQMENIYSVSCHGDFDNEDVYDISISEASPYFFANNILVHNTDSAYFSAYETMKDDPDFKDFEWTKDNVVALYDQIAEEVNQSFCKFMMDSFNVSKDRGQVIKAAREVCGISGIFIKKKRYAIMVYDDEGKRKDNEEQEGEIKAMGLDIKRSDTPKTVQKFLEKLLINALSKKNEDEIIQFIRDYRKEFNNMPSWEKGMPKGVNALTEYMEKERKSGKKVNMPGHVRASINWNRMRELYEDRYSMPIVDGAKVIVCELKPNPFKMSSIAYPVDETHLPRWFRELPFDDENMEEKLIDQKVKNLIGVLDIDLSKAKTNQAFEELFDF